MKAILFVSLMIVGVLSEPRILSEDTLQQIKSKANWQSYDWNENPFRFYTHQEIHALFGVKLKYDRHNIHLLVDNDDHSKLKDLPPQFDSRTQWPDCVFEVRNQQHCGSCWAFSATEVLQERFCIASNGQIKKVLSPQDMVSCDSDDNGCQGGLLNTAWGYLESTGVVEEECFKYVSADGKNVPHCPHGTCDDGELQYIKYRAIDGSSKPLTCAAQIKEELVANGSVQTGFMVYEDFMHYKGGIYEHTSGNELGGHAVKIVGYGNEDGKEFWIAQNSWGPNWGENGYFRIAFGQCEFDANAYVGLAKIDDFTPRKFLNFKKWIAEKVKHENYK